MVITVEPGCYFNPFLLRPAFQDPAQAPFLNQQRLEGSMVRKGKTACIKSKRSSVLSPLDW